MNTYAGLLTCYRKSHLNLIVFKSPKFMRAILLAIYPFIDVLKYCIIFNNITYMRVKYQQKMKTACI